MGENGRLKKIHILSVTLSHSRKSYVEAVLDGYTLSDLLNQPSEVKKLLGL